MSFTGSGKTVAAPYPVQTLQTQRQTARNAVGVSTNADSSAIWSNTIFPDGLSRDVMTPPLCNRVPLGISLTGMSANYNHLGWLTVFASVALLLGSVTVWRRHA